ncbi:MAG TPA: cellulose binding domain-containing protein [Streptosporangiaceae bacterium]|nr:cellulose binding domain-containing protein [Streptosporangiaceae bacterium]
MTSRASGRRRRLTLQISPNSLLFEPAGTHRGVLARDRRAFTVALSASLAGVTAAVLVGSLAPLNSTWAADRGTGAAAGQSQVPVPGSPVPGSAVSGAAVPWSVSSLGALAGPAVSQQPPSRAGQLPTSTRPLGGLTSGKDGKGGKHRKGRTVGDGRGHGPHRGRQPGQPGQRGQSSQPGQPGVAAGMGAGSGTAGSGTAGSVPPVVVSYVVDREWAGGFQGQVRVVNNGTRPIAGWQAVIALPRDRVTWFWNASGFVSHHIMLLRPLSADEVVPAGGTLSVFFTATGPETTPQACAFDGIYCG